MSPRKKIILVKGASEPVTVCDAIKSSDRDIEHVICYFRTALEHKLPRRLTVLNLDKFTTSDVRKRIIKQDRRDFCLALYQRAEDRMFFYQITNDDVVESLALNGDTNLRAMLKHYRPDFVLERGPNGRLISHGLVAWKWIDPLIEPDVEALGLYDCRCPFKKRVDNTFNFDCSTLARYVDENLQGRYKVPFTIRHRYD